MTARNDRDGPPEEPPTLPPRPGGPVHGAGAGTGVDSGFGSGVASGFAATGFPPEPPGSGSEPIFLTPGSAGVAPRVIAEHATLPPSPSERAHADAREALAGDRARSDAAAQAAAAAAAAAASAAAAAPDQSGFALQGAPAERYAYMGELGRGGMGAVYRVLDRDLEREVALKVLLEDVGHDPGCVARFVAEARAMADLQHPGIIPVYDFGIDALGHAYFTMKLVEGRTLAKVIQEAKKGGDPETAREFRLFRLLEVVIEIARAVAYAHNKGVVHRDMKPQNVMIGRFGEVQVMDWGLAKAARKDVGSQSGAFAVPVMPPTWHLPMPPIPPKPEGGTGTLPLGGRVPVLPSPAGTGAAPAPQFPPFPAPVAFAPPGAPPIMPTPKIAPKPSGRFSATGPADTIMGTIIGTPAYMAPEQAAGDPAKIGAWTDIFALGAILYHVLTGRPPFQSDAQSDVLDQVRRVAYKPPRALNPSVPREVEAICVKALAARREDRYASAEALAADLQAFLEHEPVAAYPEGPLSRAWKFAKRQRLAVAGTLATVALAAGLGQGLATYERSRDRRLAEEKRAARRLTAQRDFEAGEKGFEDAYAVITSLRAPIWERRASVLRAGELWMYFAHAPRTELEARDRLVMAGEPEPSRGTALARYRAREAERAESRRAAEERAVDAEKALRRARDTYFEVEDRRTAERAEVRRLLHLARLAITRGSSSAVGYMDAAAPGVEKEDAPLLAEARGVGRVKLSIPSGEARASFFAVDPDTLVASTTPISRATALPLPIDVRELPPGEYHVVVMASDLSPHDARERAIRFPILLAAGDLQEIDLPIGPKDVPPGFAYVPAGPALIGSRHSAVEERPMRFVDVPAFFIARRETTAAEVQRAFAAAPPVTTVAESEGKSISWVNGGWDYDLRGASYRMPLGGATPTAIPLDQLPASHLSHGEATIAAKRLGGRLPTDVEWEKAARGIDGRRMPWGESDSAEGPSPRANFFEYGEHLDGYAQHAPVGHYGFGFSPYGALDMVGNVYEWTAGTMRPHAEIGTTAPLEKPGAPHCYRGCSWVDDEADMRIAYRAIETPLGYHDGSTGMRLARDVHPTPPR